MSSQACIGLLLNYREASRSIRCIRSLLSEGATRVLVWDNSADGGISASIIEAEFAVDARVSMHISASNLGFAAGVNRGLTECIRLLPAARILLINNDAVLLPGALHALMEALTYHPQASIAYPNIDHSGRVLAAFWYHRVTGLLFRRRRCGSFLHASGCCLMIAVDRAPSPLFDETFFMYGEDCELGWRLSKQAGALIHVDKVLVVHEGSASSGLGTPFYENHMVAAHLILARKLASSGADEAMLRVARYAMLVARACVRSLRFRSMVPWRALREGRRIAKESRR